MPLQSGKGEKKHGANVAELIASYKKTGRIGNAKPKNLAHAERMANAIAFQKRRQAGEKVATGPGGHNPDGTGPHGRGMGPGKGRGNGSGMQKA